MDRFGRLWEGRYGGIDKPVLGGHTAGFNEHTFAVVALGNFQSTAPSAQSLARMKDSLARLFAWKLGLYQVSPVGTARLVSAGYSKPTRYAKGTVAAIPTISSHQMMNYTSCPGVYLQRQLPGIRALAARYAHVVIRPPTPAVTSVRSGSASWVALTSSADRAVKWRADIFGPCSTEPVRSFTGRTNEGRADPDALGSPQQLGPGAAARRVHAADVRDRQGRLDRAAGLRQDPDHARRRVVRGGRAPT